MSKSTMLISIGLILIGIAFLTASSIPLKANRDLTTLHKQMKRGNAWVTSIQGTKGDIYIQAHGYRRLLQNFYLGASGLICLSAGLLSLPNKNRHDIPAQSRPLTATASSPA